MTNQPAIWNFELRAGCTFDVTVEFREPDDEDGNEGALIDLSDYDEIIWVAKPSRDHATKTIDKNVSDYVTGSGIINGGVAGTIRFQLTAAETALINDKSLVHDVTLINTAASPVVKDPFSTGTITVVKEML